jgi:hypothetical protein
MSKRSLNILVLAIVLGLLWPVSVTAQKLTSLITTANGQGTVKSNTESYDLTGVLVILREDGTASITLFAGLQLYMQADWSVGDDLSQGVDLKITGGVVAGNAVGTGKLFLNKDKSIRALNFEAKSTSDTTVIVEFVAGEKSKSSTSLNLERF